MNRKGKERKNIRIKWHLPFPIHMRFVSIRQLQVVFNSRRTIIQSSPNDSLNESSSSLNLFPFIRKKVKIIELLIYHRYHRGGEKGGQRGKKSRVPRRHTVGSLVQRKTPRNIKEDKRPAKSVSFIIHAANFSRRWAPLRYCIIWKILE